MTSPRGRLPSVALLGILAAGGCRSAASVPGAPHFSTAPLAEAEEPAGLAFRGRLIAGAESSATGSIDSTVEVPWASPGEAPAARSAHLLLPDVHPVRPEDRFAVILAGAPPEGAELPLLLLQAGGIVLDLEGSPDSLKPAVDWLRDRFLLDRAATGVLLAEGSGAALLHSALEHAGFVLFSGAHLSGDPADPAGLPGQPAALLWMEREAASHEAVCRDVCRWREAGLEIFQLAAAGDAGEEQRLRARVLDFLDGALRPLPREQEYRFARDIAGHSLRLWVRARDREAARRAAEVTMALLQRPAFSPFPGRPVELPPLGDWVAPAVTELQGRGLPACLLLDQTLAVAVGPEDDDSRWCVASLGGPGFPPELLRDAALCRVPLPDPGAASWLVGPEVQSTAAAARELAELPSGDWAAFLANHAGIRPVSTVEDPGNR